MVHPQHCNFPKNVKGAPYGRFKVSKNNAQRTAQQWFFRLILHFWGTGKFNQLRTFLNLKNLKEMELSIPQKSQLILPPEFC